MDKHDIIRKLTSRKFIISAITALAGLTTLFIGHGEEVNTIAGALMTIVPTLVYCIVEGRVDAASVNTIGTAASNAADQLGATEAADKIDEITDVAETIVNAADALTEEDSEGKNE